MSMQQFYLAVGPVCFQIFLGLVLLCSKSVHCRVKPFYHPSILELQQKTTDHCQSGQQFNWCNRLSNSSLWKTNVSLQQQYLSEMASPVAFALWKIEPLLLRNNDVFEILQKVKLFSKRTKK